MKFAVFRHFLIEFSSLMRSKFEAKIFLPQKLYLESKLWSRSDTAATLKPKLAHKIYETPKLDYCIL